MRGRAARVHEVTLLGHGAGQRGMRNAVVPPLSGFPFRSFRYPLSTVVQKCKIRKSLKSEGSPEKLVRAKAKRFNWKQVTEGNLKKKAARSFL